MRKSSRRSAGKSHQKSTLPQKICAVCGRPFSWRKKWEKVWEEVKYCSDRCRGAAKKKEPSAKAGEE
ncbi:MAG TPA: DUF2256 domain-containing protein [Saprospiraceae bacterium]|nr:DUF2256 domain-containing protein [Saprospiraceae bacterium]HMP22999.1 DUF2256 domain-containing protein [Saprospiraceae bacterium]